MRLQSEGCGMMRDSLELRVAALRAAQLEAHELLQLFPIDEQTPTFLNDHAAPAKLAKMLSHARPRRAHEVGEITMSDWMGNEGAPLLLDAEVEAQLQQGEHQADAKIQRERVLASQ